MTEFNSCDERLHAHATFETVVRDMEQVTIHALEKGSSFFKKF